MADNVVDEEPQEAEEVVSALEGMSVKDKDEDREEEKEGAGEEEGKKDDAGETGEAAKEIEKKEEGEEEVKKAEEVSILEQLQGEVKDLRQMVRTSKRELTVTQAKLNRLGEKPAESDKDDDDDDDDEGKGKGKDKKESLSIVEELQEKIAHIGATRGASLDILLETMEQNAKYVDIREVCSRENFDDIFEAIATESTKGGGNFDETLLDAELSVWSKSNPYKYMYELIKKYHPNYAEKEGAAAPGSKKSGGKVPEKVKAPGTIADKGGDSNLKSGWTAKRINDLPEEELHTVPREIYEKYMRDDLD